MRPDVVGRWASSTTTVIVIVSSSGGVGGSGRLGGYIERRLVGALNLELWLNLLACGCG